MHVYVIASEGGMVKIGKANDPEKRVRELSTGHPYRLRLAHVFPCDSEDRSYAVEQAAHTALATRRMSGEWFSVSPSDAKAVLENITSPCLEVEVVDAVDLDPFHVAVLQDAVKQLAELIVIATVAAKERRARRCDVIAASEATMKIADHLRMLADGGDL